MSNFQVVFDQTIGAGVVKNVTNWQLPDNQLSTKQTFADNIRAEFATHAVSHMSTSWTLESLTFRQMDGGGAFTELVTFGLGPLAGVAASALLPRQSSLLVSTGFLGPKPNRGRVFFGGLTESANDAGGVVSVGALADFQLMVEHFRDGIATGAGNAFLRIARPNFTLNVWTLNNPVESVIARAQWSTQRRRKPGVGV